MSALTNPILALLLTIAIGVSPGTSALAQQCIFSRVPSPPLDLLGRGDARAWADYVDRIARRGDGLLSTPAARSLRAGLKKLSPSERSNLLQLIAARYADAPKFSEGSLAAKRALDLLLSWTIDAETIFRDGLKEGASPLECYDHYLRRMNVAVGNTPNSWAGFRAKEVLAVAKEVQAYLRAHPDAPASVSITGSFANGRTKRGSDLDFDFESKSPTESARDKAALQSLPGRVLGDKKLPAEAHAMGVAQVTQVMPIAVRVTADRIELLVYQPEVNWSRDRRPVMTMELP